MDIVSFDRKATGCAFFLPMMVHGALSVGATREVVYMLAVYFDLLDQVAC